MLVRFGKGYARSVSVHMVSSGCMEMLLPSPVAEATGCNVGSFGKGGAQHQRVYRLFRRMGRPLPSPEAEAAGFISYSLRSAVTCRIADCFAEASVDAGAEVGGASLSCY